MPQQFSSIPLQLGSATVHVHLAPSPGLSEHDNMRKTNGFAITWMVLTMGVSYAEVTTDSLYAELERIQDNHTALHSTIAPSWVSAPNIRGTSDILYSCLLTLFACIYTALHLNVPPRGTTAARLLVSKC